MELKTLQSAMIAAMKARDKARKDSISLLIGAVKMEAINKGCREDIPEEMVDAVILKEVKMAKEQVDTCPADRTDLKAEYEARYNVFKEFAPAQMDEAEIEAYIRENFADLVAAKDKGALMKNVMPALKGKADGKLINQMVGKICG